MTGKENMAERLEIFCDTTNWIMTNHRTLSTDYSGIIAVYGTTVIGADRDIEKVWSLARASGYPLEHIVIMDVDDPLNCSGIAT
jgi:hypothetical protein